MSCDLHVSVVSLPRPITAVNECPSVCFFGPTLPRLWWAREQWICRIKLLSLGFEAYGKALGIRSGPVVTATRHFTFRERSSARLGYLQDVSRSLEWTVVEVYLSCLLT